MVSTPVLIMTLCRYEHFRRCVESLKQNPYAKDTELYIGVDYPLKESHWDGYNRICAYLDKGIDGFKEVHIRKWDRNLGALENYCRMRKLIFEQFDRFIYSEDDNEFSYNYLEYMNKAMVAYENDSSVLAVSGYMYPIDLMDTSGNILFLDMYFSAFGKGVYKRTEDLFAENINMDTFMKMYRNTEKMWQLRRISVNQYCNFVKGMVGYIPDLMRGSDIRRCDLSYGLYMFFHDYKMVFPQMSKVRNWGYDGSGINCTSQVTVKTDIKQGAAYYRNYDFSMQEIDENPFFGELCVISDDDRKVVDNRLKQFFAIPKKEEWITVITYYFSLIVGPRRMASLIKRIKKFKR